MSDTNNRHDNVAQCVEHGEPRSHPACDDPRRPAGCGQGVRRGMAAGCTVDRHPMAYELARYFVLEYMRSATASCVAVTADGEFAGVTLARIDGQPLAFPQTEGMLVTCGRSSTRTRSPR